MLEFYQAYADYRDLMDLTEELLSQVARVACGTERVTYQGQEISFAPPYPRLSVEDALVTLGGLSADEVHTAERSGPRPPPGDSGESRLGMGQAIDGAVRGCGREALHPAHLHHGLPGGAVSAGQGATGTRRAMSSGSSCTSPAWRWPTPTPS